MERLRQEYDALPDGDPEDDITREEFENAVSRMKNSKSTGPDEIPAEVWKHSTVAKEDLFQFLQSIWRKEKVPANLAVCVCDDI